MEHDGAGAPGRLATLLRAHRRAAGLTQRQLAARAGISPGTVEDLEQGRTGRPRPESLARLAAALRLTEDQRGELAGAGRPHGQRHPGDGLRLSVLGPLAAWRDGTAADLGPARQRAVLGLLALHAGAALPRAALVDALWPEDPPPTAVVMVQAQISRIRRLLAPAARRSWDGPAYRLGPGAMSLDLTEFTRLSAHARQAVAAGHLPGACTRYERALALWRGQPLDTARARQPGSMSPGAARAMPGRAGPPVRRTCHGRDR